MTAVLEQNDAPEAFTPARGTRSPATCRSCHTPLHQTFVDLGMSPLCESYLGPDQVNGMEPFYPLHVYVCTSCFLVQLEEYVRPEAIFTEYAYFSSYSESWLAHARQYTDKMIAELRLDPSKLVVEVASNDGYLLQYFVARGIPSLGIDPAANVAVAARERGVPTLVDFFGRAPGHLHAERPGVIRLTDARGADSTGVADRGHR